MNDIIEAAKNLAADAVALLEAAAKIKNEAKKKDLLRSAAANCKVAHDYALKAVSEVGQ